MSRKTAAAPARRRKVVPKVPEPELPPADDWQLSKSQLRELERRIRDMEDPRRWVLASEFLPTFVLYYEVSENVYVMNDLQAATSFKDRKIAVAVKKLLGKDIRVVECRKLKNGKLKRVTPVRPRVGPARRKRAGGQNA